MDLVCTVHRAQFKASPLPLVTSCFPPSPLHFLSLSSCALNQDFFWFGLVVVVFFLKEACMTCTAYWTGAAAIMTPVTASTVVAQPLCRAFASIPNATLGLKKKKKPLRCSFTSTRRPCACSLPTCVQPPVCRARAACHCLSPVMDVLFVARARTHTRAQACTHTARKNQRGVGRGGERDSGRTPPARSVHSRMSSSSV